MNDPRHPGRGHERGPNMPWYQRPPDADDHTSIARPRPAAPGAYRPRVGNRPPPPADIPWYLARPDRPSVPAPARDQKPAVAPHGTGPAERKRLIPWLLAAAGGLALVTGIAIVIGGVAKLGITGGTVLDVAKVQNGVLQTLSDPASGYGANTVSDVSCNNSHNPGAVKGTTFTCDAIVNGSQRQVTVVVSDDYGTYEVDGPR